MNQDLTAEELKVIDRVEKLLALAASSNEHEAKLAASKAAELLTVYNLTVEQVNVNKEKYIIEDLFQRGKSNMKDHFIHSILMEYFFIVFIQDKIWDQLDEKMIIAFRMAGTKANTKVAGFVLGFLNRKFPECFEAYRLYSGCKLGSRYSYYKGLKEGICLQLELAKIRAESSTGLIKLAKDPMLENFLDEKGFVDSNKIFHIRFTDSAAQAAGTEHGKALRIQKGIDNTKSTERGRLLK